MKADVEHNITQDWLDIHAKDIQDSGTYRIAGGHDFALSNRISYEYDLKGPSFTIKAGCSASMIALHQAVRAIQSGECSGAIVAGTNLIFSPTMSIAMTEQGVLSPDGSCKTFDAAANGYARGEAVNALYLKPLSEAIKSNDPVRAIIRATASNADGKTPGMSMPSVETHEMLMRQAYHEAGLDPADTVFVEAHGTGTAVGDPLEATAISRVFGRDHGQCTYIGSVKPNLGHSEGASGISSILKAISALENKIIPPNINFSTPNPKIPFREANMQVPVDPIPWPSDKPLRISVNSFGIGGANAHCIIDSADSFNGLSGLVCEVGNLMPDTPDSSVDGRTVESDSDNGSSEIINGHLKSQTDGRVKHHVKSFTDASNINGSVTSVDKATNVRGTGQSTNNGAARNVNGDRAASDCIPLPSLSPVGKNLQVLSAANSDSLSRAVVEYQGYMQAYPARLADISYTLCNRREHLSHRAYCVSDQTKPETVPDFSAISKQTKTPTINMVFTGQGAQWVGMAKELIEDYPSFEEDIDRLNNQLQRLSEAPAWDLKEELCKPDSNSKLARAELSQPLVCAVQIALVNLLRAWGIQPAAVVGHSSGEIAAAYACEAISAEEAITIAYYRGYVTRGYHRAGAMAAVGLSTEEAKGYLLDGVVVACENSQQSVTLSGDKEAVEKICHNIQADNADVFVRLLKVEMAYHSREFLSELWPKRRIRC